MTLLSIFFLTLIVCMVFFEMNQKKYTANATETVIDKHRMSGFTLIEMIGVLAVISILSAVIAPPVIQQINRAVSDSEASNLKALASSVHEYILAHQKIPGSLTWASDVASINTLPLNQVAKNDRGFARGYYVDPASIINQKTGYTQANAQIPLPTSPRIMLVSNLKANVPAAPTSAAAFNKIWDQSAGASLIESADIKIQRMHLGAMFHHVMLTNLYMPAPPLNPSYKIGVSGPYPITSGSSVNLYVLKGSTLSLLLHTGALSATMLVVQTDTFQYGSNGLNWLWGR